MKKILLMAAVSVLALSSYNANAAEIKGTGNIAARIVEPISLTELQKLNFGAILAGDTANTVTVTPGSVRSATDSTKLVGTTTKAGEWEITGPAMARPILSFPTSATISNGSGATMTVSNFKHNLTASGEVIPGNAGEQSSLSFDYGADLAVGANQDAGLYEGTYEITVSY